MTLIGSAAVKMAMAMALLWQAVPGQPAATFAGVFRGIASGHVIIEVDGGQDLQMFVTGGTKYVREGKPAKASEFHDGDTVEVEAVRDLRMNLVAKRVEAVKPKPKKPADESGSQN